MALEGANQFTGMTEIQARKHAMATIGMAAPVIYVVKQLAKTYDLSFQEAFVVYDWLEDVVEASRRREVMDSLGENFTRLMDSIADDDDDEPWKESL